MRVVETLLLRFALAAILCHVLLVSAGVIR